MELKKNFKEEYHAAALRWIFKCIRCEFAALRETNSDSIIFSRWIKHINRWGEADGIEKEF